MTGIRWQLRQGRHSRSSAIATVCAAIAVSLGLTTGAFAFAGSPGGPSDGAALGSATANVHAVQGNEPVFRRTDPYAPRRGRTEDDRFVPEPEPLPRSEGGTTYDDRDERYDDRRRADPIREPDYRAPRRRGDDVYRAPPRDDAYRPPRKERYGDTYAAPRRNYDDDVGPDYRDDGYSESEIVTAGHRFFGKVSQGLAKAIQRLFKRSGRPNGYILGQDAGGAFVAGLRYGEGRLYTKHLGERPVYWQGPTVGYDFGGEGSKVMVLVYNLRRPGQIYKRFGGVQGSAYVVGGISVQLQKHGSVTMAPIRAGVGLRLGANVGYLKYTRRPTWNPF